MPAPPPVVVYVSGIPTNESSCDCQMARHVAARVIATGRTAERGGMIGSRVADGATVSICCGIVPRYDFDEDSGLAQG